MTDRATLSDHGHQVGANKAFEQCADAARDALAAEG